MHKIYELYYLTQSIGSVCHQTAKTICEVSQLCIICLLKKIFGIITGNCYILQYKCQCPYYRILQ